MKTRLFVAACFFAIQASTSEAQVAVATNKVKPTASASASGTIAQAAHKSGVIKCANRVEQHENFFAQQNNAVGALMFIAPKDANNRLFSLSSEIVEQNESAYVSSTYAPAGKDDCSASYDMVKYWQSSCQDVANKIFPQFGNPLTLKRQITALGKDANVKIFLMPAGEGCVSIKKEIVY